MRHNTSPLHVAQRCSCGNALEALFAAVLPNVPAGKLRVETGLAYDVGTRRLSSTLSVEGQSYGTKTGYGGRTSGYNGPRVETAKRVGAKRTPARKRGGSARKPKGR